ncbi:hypothetical protein Tco_0721922, partial [Tanacetum coccineum]
VLWRLKLSTRKGLEFGALLENFGGNGPKSNGVKRRDLVWVRMSVNQHNITVKLGEMTVAFVATSIGFKEDNSCCKKLLQGATLAIATAKLRGECPKDQENMDLSHFFRKMVADSNAPVQDKALQHEFPPCLSLPPAPCFNVLL